MPRHRVIAFTLSLFTAACAPAASQSPAPAAEGLALTHVTVVDVERGRLLTDRTVLIRGSHIVHISPADGAALPLGTTVIDGRGKYLIPGLWDMHVHSAGSARQEFPVYLALGVTGVRNMHTTADTALELTSSIARQVAAGTLLGPRFIANGPIVDGPRPAQRGSARVGTPDEAHRVVDSLADGGAGFIKIYNLLPRDAYFAVLEQARRRSLAVAGHIPFTVRAEEAAEAGQRSVEHLDGLDFACSTHEDSIRAAFLARPSREAWQQADAALTATWSAERCGPAIAAFRRHRTWQVPTLVVGQAEAAADSVLAGTRAMAVVPVAAAEGWREMAAQMPAESRRLERTRLEHSIATVRLLHRAGVPILAGTDVGNPFVVPGHSLHRELELLVESGLSPLEALQAATLNPALYLEATDSLGTVEAGKLADLVLLDANPLDDIRNTAQIRAVMVNGRYLDRDALDALLARAGSTTTAP
jgi:imidazolonepropionase-like amidohydrolase